MNRMKRRAAAKVERHVKVTNGGAPRCANCRFWQRRFDQENKATDSGDCCRRAPVVVNSPFVLTVTEVNGSQRQMGVPQVSSWFPSTGKDKWCGEHEPTA